jgi:hypothetical protein
LGKFNIVKTTVQLLNPTGPTAEHFSAHEKVNSSFGYLHGALTLTSRVFHISTILKKKNSLFPVQQVRKANTKI